MSAFPSEKQTKRLGADVHAFDAPGARTDCFVISGAKVLEGYGKVCRYRCRSEEFQRSYHDGCVL
jgi:hypothetical protein